MSERTFIKIDGVPKGLKKDIRNIAQNLGVSMGDLIKPELRKLADSYPENMKRPPQA